MNSILIKPEQMIIWCEYLLLDPVSHHDPGQADKSNFSMYRRQLQRIRRENAGRAIAVSEVESICALFPIPIEAALFFEDEPFSRFVGTALVEIFIEMYGGAEGTGLFSGFERYRRLEDRATQTASRVTNLKEFWSILTKEMRVGSPLSDEIYPLMTLLSVPPAFANEVLYQFAKYSQLIVMLARSWAETKKAGNLQYAQKAGIQVQSGKTIVLKYDAPDTAHTEVSIPIPTHSANDIRHDLREASMYYLLNQLGFTLEDELPKEIKSLLENAGAMSESSPSNAYQQTQIIRARFPHLGLLGGSMPGFLLGEGNLQSVSTYYEGLENNEVLEEIGVQSQESVWDLLDQWTLVRHSGRTEESPMPFSFETVQKGARLYVRFQLHPLTTELEIGALVAALDTFIDTDGAIGGQSARGFGRVKVSYLQFPDGFFSMKDGYREYLQANQSDLRVRLITGELS